MTEFSSRAAPAVTDMPEGAEALLRGAAGGLMVEAAAWRGGRPVPASAPLLRRKPGAAPGLCGSIGPTRPAPAGRPDKAALAVAEAALPRAEQRRQEAIGRRSAELLRDKESGKLRRLELAPCYPLRVNGRHLGVFRPAFAYWDGHAHVVEDIVTECSADYGLRRQLASALYGITVRTYRA